MKARDDESEGPARRASSPPPPPQRRLPGTKGESGRALRYPTSPPASWTHPPTARAGRASAPAAPDWNRLRYSSLAWSVAIRAIRARVAGPDVYSVAERPGADGAERTGADGAGMIRGLLWQCCAVGHALPAVPKAGIDSDWRAAIGAVRVGGRKEWFDQLLASAPRVKHPF